MRNKFEDGEEVESMSFDRPSSPSSVTHESIESQSSGTLTPDTTAIDDEAGLLYDADELNEKTAAKIRVAPFTSSRYLWEHPVIEDGLRCSLLPRRLAVWIIKGSGIKLSALAAAVLINENKLVVKDLDV